MASLSDIIAPVLDGTSEFFDIADEDSLGNGISPFTICMWLRFNTGFSGIQPIFSKWDTTTANQSYNLIYNSATTDFIVGASVGGSDEELFTFNFKMVENNWVFITLRFTGTQVQVLTDEFQIGTGDFGIPFNGAAPLFIGKHVDDVFSFFLNGAVTVLSTYNGSLSDAEIAQVREVSTPDFLSNNINAVMTNFWPLYFPEQFTNLKGTLPIHGGCDVDNFSLACLPVRTLIFETFLGNVIEKCGVCYSYDCVIYDGIVADPTPITGPFNDCATCWGFSSSSSRSRSSSSSSDLSSSSSSNSKSSDSSSSLSSSSSDSSSDSSGSPSSSSVSSSSSDSSSSSRSSSTSSVSSTSSSRSSNIAFGCVDTAHFTSGSDYFSTAATPIDAEADSFTISMWIYPEFSPNPARFIWRQFLTSTFFIILRFTSDELLFFTTSGVSGGSGGVTAPATMDTWQQIVITHNASTNVCTMYINAVVVDTSPNLITNIPVPSPTTHIGGDGSDNFEGKMAFVKMWVGRSLSSGDVTELYNSGIPKCHANLSSGLKAGLDHSWELGNWDAASTGDETTDQVGNSNLTNNGSVPFVENRLEELIVTCTGTMSSCSSRSSASTP